jgi:hypothetical protein
MDKFFWKFVFWFFFWQKFGATFQTNLIQASDQAKKILGAHDIHHNDTRVNDIL